MNITDDYWKLELFVESFDTMMRLVLPDNQREQNVAAFRSKFRLDRQSLLLQTYSEPILDLDKVFKKTIPEPSVIITSPISFQAKDATPKPPIKSPVSNSQVNPTTPRPLASDQTPTVTSTFSRYSAHVPGVQHSIQSPSPQVTGNFSSAVFETLQSQISNLQNLVELKHQECVGLIEKSLKSKLEKHQDNDYKLEEVFKEHNSCDHQEFAILSSMEYLLTENKAEDALRLLRWRKKILKLANMNGWEIAEDVARRTLQKLEVTSSDIIDSNFRSMMGKNSVNSR